LTIFAKSAIFIPTNISLFGGKPMKFKVFCAHTGRSLLAEDQLLDAPTQVEAMNHYLKEMDGQYTDKDVRLEAVEQTTSTFKLHKPRPRKCPACAYNDIAGADTCPNCGYDDDPTG
jgi:hypothetical protein